MLGGITRGTNKIDTKNHVNAADHLEVVLAMAAIPLPSRRPNEAERVDGEEDYADCNQSNLEEFFARDVVHAEPVPVGNLRSQILVVQSAQNWHRQNATGRLNSMRYRRILLQR